MREINASELSKILKEHKRWIDTDEDEGEKAALFKRSFHMKYIFSINCNYPQWMYTSQNYSGSYSRPFNTSQSTFNQNYGGGDLMNLDTGDYLMDMD